MSNTRSYFMDAVRYCGSIPDEVVEGMVNGQLPCLEDFLTFGVVPLPADILAGIDGFEEETRRGVVRRLKERQDLDAAGAEVLLKSRFKRVRAVAMEALSMQELSTKLMNAIGEHKDSSELAAKLAARPEAFTLDKERRDWLNSLCQSYLKAVDLFDAATHGNITAAQAAEDIAEVLAATKVKPADGKAKTLLNGLIELDPSLAETFAHSSNDYFRVAVIGTRHTQPDIKSTLGWLSTRVPHDAGPREEGLGRAVVSELVFSPLTSNAELETIISWCEDPTQSDLPQDSSNDSVSSKTGFAKTRSAKASSAKKILRDREEGLRVHVNRPISETDRPMREGLYKAWWPRWVYGDHYEFLVMGNLWDVLYLMELSEDHDEQQFIADRLLSVGEVIPFVECQLHGLGFVEETPAESLVERIAASYAVAPENPTRGDDPGGITAVTPRSGFNPAFGGWDEAFAHETCRAWPAKAWTILFKICEESRQGIVSEDDIRTADLLWRAST